MKKKMTLLIDYFDPLSQVTSSWASLVPSQIFQP